MSKQKVKHLLVKNLFALIQGDCGVMSCLVHHSHCEIRQQAHIVTCIVRHLRSGSQPTFKRVFEFRALCDGYRFCLKTAAGSNIYATSSLLRRALRVGWTRFESRFAVA